MRFTDFFRDLGPAITYHPRLNRITGSVAATILLSNLLAWEGHQRDRDGWIYKTREQLREETGLTRTEQENARKLLTGRGLMVEALRGMPAKMHYRLDLEAINDAWEGTNKLAGNLPTGREETRQHAGGKPANNYRD